MSAICEKCGVSTTTRTNSVNLLQRSVSMAMLATNADKDRNYDDAVFLYGELDIMFDLLIAEAVAKRDSDVGKAESETGLDNRARWIELLREKKAEFVARLLKLKKFIAAQNLQKAMLPIVEENQ